MNKDYPSAILRSILPKPLMDGAVHQLDEVKLFMIFEPTNELSIERSSERKNERTVS